MADAKVWGSKKEKEKMEEEKEKRELRSPDGTEPEKAADAVREVVGALRASAADGEVDPVAAAQQTVRPSRGSCGVGKWARGVVRTAIPILAPLPNIACHVMQAKSVGKLAAHGVGLAP